MATPRPSKSAHLPLPKTSITSASTPVSNTATVQVVLSESSLNSACIAQIVDAFDPKIDSVLYAVRSLGSAFHHLRSK